MLAKYFVDLHIHIGSTLENHPVKITASRKLNLINIIEECVHRKGIDIIGIVDCASPRVLKDLDSLIEKGDLFEFKGGGLSYREQLTILPGVEVESCEANGGRGHYLSFFPTLSQVKEYSRFLSAYIKNINLSTQQSYLTAQQLGETTNQLGGIFSPAHAFTPHKSLFGSCGDSLESVFSDYASKLKILELGLSSDSQMADTIADLNKLTFISNSDAHSLEKIGREYNIFELEEPSFSGVKQVLYQEKGKIVANYGLDPKLGKYHRNFCDRCKNILNTTVPVDRCPQCSSQQIIKGVYDRLKEIGDLKSVSPENRPPYYYQIPLAFLPNVGPKTIKKLIDNLGTEMEVLHKIDFLDIKDLVGAKVANTIEMARKGQMVISPGGGGFYGKITASERGNYYI
ncbi:MAG: hypothetical protein JM58_14245 [Peptococcaceae bacterium BICA1-8]|nr:MAG: hypothetical protein JM58_14245 [Peptococcaceae bacterium BICA1-8]